MPTLEVQKGALQLIVFHLQQQKPRVNMQQQINNISETESKTASSEDVNTSLIDFETTILNSAFEVNSLMLARAATTGATHSHPLSKNAVIRTILNCFENPNLNFWVILTCLSIVEDQNSLHGKLAKKFNLQLFKLILPLVNKSTISNVCGIFIYKLVKSLGDDEISHVIDSTTIILLDNIIELSEVNGPSLISKHSIIFWYTFHKVIMKTNLPRKVDVQLRIQEWWLAKFKNINSICTYIKSIGISRISEFLMWLCGVDVMNTDSLIFVREECEDYFYKGPLNEIYYFMKLFSNLQGSIVMRAGVEILDNTETVNLNRIHTLGKIAGGKTEDILTLINKRTDEICNSASDLLVVKFIRVLLFLNICTIAKGLGSISIFTLMLESGIHKCQEEILDIEFTKPAIVEYTDIINKCSKSLIKGLSDKNIGFIKKIFIVNSMVHSMRDHELRNIGYHLNDGFDEDFKSANSANLPTSTPSSYLSLKYCTIRSSRIQILQLMMNLCLRDQISTFENYFPIILDLLNHMNENELLNACVLIVDSCNIDAFSNISTFYIRKFLRIVGEGPLTSPILERNELTIILISKLLGLLIPTITNNPDIELKKDWLDMANWLVKCGEKRLIQSERSFIEYTCFLILSVNLEKVYEVEFMENFFHATNNVKISIVSSAKNLFIGSLPTLLQMSLYKGLFLNFEYPQKSVESSATFCLFFSLLCGINSSFFPINILVSIIFNLIEYYKFHFFIPYIRAAIYQICSSFIGAISPRDLFKLIKFDLLKYWWIYKKSIQEFPYELFGYLDIRSLIELNYKELAAICLSIKTGDVRRKANEKQLICEIAKLKRIDEASIVIDSFPLIIALAYTESGVKNDIQQILKNILGKSYSEQFKLRLLIILLEIIKFIDLSHEKNLKVNDLSEELILNNSEILTPRGVSVSYGSGIELLQTLVGKYLPNASEFWGIRKYNSS